jgi:hypothetical protein
MARRIKYKGERFHEVFEEQLAAVQSMIVAMEAIGDRREVCVIQIMKAVEKWLGELLEIVDLGEKKILWHEFLFFPEIFYGFPDVHPMMAEVLAGFLPVLDPEGLNAYIDASENMGLPADICPADKGLLGSVLLGALPPADVVVAPTSPCDSAITGYQILAKLVDAPVLQCDVPYWQDLSSSATCPTGRIRGVWSSMRTTSGR